MIAGSVVYCQNKYCRIMRLRQRQQEQKFQQFKQNFERDLILRLLYFFIYRMLRNCYRYFKEIQSSNNASQYQDPFHAVCFHCLRKYCLDKKSIDNEDQYSNVFIRVIFSIIWDDICTVQFTIFYIRKYYLEYLAYKQSGF